MTRGAELTRSIVIGLIAIVLASAAPHADAALTNGSFETGDFSGWDTIGNTSVVTASFGTTPTHGTHQALMTTGSGSVSDSSIEAFLGLNAGTLDSLSSGDAIEGSAIKQSVTANAGDILAFDWNFLTDEGSRGSQFNDFAFWSLFNINNGEVLADTLSLLQPSGTTFTSETGYFSKSFVVTSAGSYTLGFGVMDTGDNKQDSGLLVDNVSLTSSEPADAIVPEPCSAIIWALLGVGSLGTGWRRRRASASCPQ